SVITFSRIISGVTSTDTGNVSAAYRTQSHGAAIAGSEKNSLQNHTAANFRASRNGSNPAPRINSVRSPSFFGSFPSTSAPAHTFHLLQSGFFIVREFVLRQFHVTDVSFSCSHR